jgi:hypothetical protein
MRRRPAFVLLALAVASCGISRESRIEARLEKAGMKPKLARCMAHKLNEKLSDDELSELADATRRQPDGERLNGRALAAQIVAIDDPHLVETVSRALLGCSILD